MTNDSRELVAKWRTDARVLIEMHGAGDETAMGFSLCADELEEHLNRPPQPGSFVWQLSTRIGDLTAENTRLYARIAAMENAPAVAVGNAIADVFATAEGAKNPVRSHEDSTG